MPIARAYSGLDDAESIGLAFYFLGVSALMWGGRRPAVSNGLGGALLSWIVLPLASLDPGLRVRSGDAAASYLAAVAASRTGTPDAMRLRRLELLFPAARG